MIMQNDNFMKSEEIMLNSFDADTRFKTLLKLASEEAYYLPPEKPLANMHFHSFFSYNSENWSPSRIAWEAKKSGLFAAGVIEFDVIDGLDEFLNAGELLSLRTAVGVETRTFFAKFADMEINSPGEPGVNYAIAAGFSKKLATGSNAEKTLLDFKKRATQRNIALIRRINEKIPSIAVDYEKDVIPLTPSGNPTERHIVTAYIAKSEKINTDSNANAKFWSDVSGKPESEVLSIMNDRPAFEELVRAKLAKKGGFGYVQPGPESFPPLSEFYKWAKECGTIPTVAWLDGTSAAESNPENFLNAIIAEGAMALNIIPDRNWNIKNPDAKKLKVAKLAEIVNLADKLDMPIIIGTEMNKKGLPLVDNTEEPPLSDFKQIFLRGAKILVGHTILAKFANFPYSSSAAESRFGKNIKAKNAFFESVATLPPITNQIANKLSSKGAAKAYSAITDSVKKNFWIV